MIPACPCFPGARTGTAITSSSAATGLAGGFVRDTERDGQARVLALQVSESSGLDWSPHRGYLLAPGTG